MTSNHVKKKKECYNCHTKETPLWRRSIDGGSLCNACGLYLRNHGSNRPVSVPARSPQPRQPDVKSKYANDVLMEKIVIESLIDLKYKSMMLNLRKMIRSNYIDMGFGGAGFENQLNLRLNHTDMNFGSYAFESRQSSGPNLNDFRIAHRQSHYLGENNYPNSRMLPQPRKRLNTMEEYDDKIDEEAIEALMHIK